MKNCSGLGSRHLVDRTLKRCRAPSKRYKVMPVMWVTALAILVTAAPVLQVASGQTGARSVDANSNQRSAQRTDTGSTQSDQMSIAAVIEATPKNLPRAAGPSLASAIEAAKAANQACVDKGVKVSVLVTDSAGETIVLLTGDGASIRSQLVARTKANIVVKYGTASIYVANRAKRDPALLAEAKADPYIGQLRGGGEPFFRNGKVVGVVAVAGASLWPAGSLTLDEQCAKVGVKWLEMHYE